MESPQHGLANLDAFPSSKEPLNELHIHYSSTIFIISRVIVLWTIALYCILKFYIVEVK